MVSVLTTLLLIVLLFLTVKIFESVKRLLILVVDVFLKLLNIFGIHINLHEKREHTSKKFKKLYKDISVVRKSKQNEKTVHSINIFALSLLLLCIVIVTINITQNSLVSIYIYNNITIITTIFNSVDKVDTTLTATMFSIIAFSMSKLLYQWKNTAIYRKAKKEIKLKNKVLMGMSSKELLDLAK